MRRESTGEGHNHLQRERAQHARKRDDGQRRISGEEELGEPRGDDDVAQPRRRERARQQVHRRRPRQPRLARLEADDADANQDRRLRDRRRHEVGLPLATPPPPQPWHGPWRRRRWRRVVRVTVGVLAVGVLAVGVLAVGVLAVVSGIGGRRGLGGLDPDRCRLHPLAERRAHETAQQADAADAEQRREHAAGASHRPQVAEADGRHRRRGKIQRVHHRPSLEL